MMNTDARAHWPRAVTLALLLAGLCMALALAPSPRLLQPDPLPDWHAWRWLYVQVIVHALLATSILAASLWKTVRTRRPQWLRHTLAIPAWGVLVATVALCSADTATWLSQQDAASHITARAPQAPAPAWQYRSFWQSVRVRHLPHRPAHTRIRWNGHCYHWSYRVMAFQMQECPRSAAQDAS